MWWPVLSRMLHWTALGAVASTPAAVCISQIFLLLSFRSALVLPLQLLWQLLQPLLLVCGGGAPGSDS